MNARAAAIAAGLLLALGGCSRAPTPDAAPDTPPTPAPHVALWQVCAPAGACGWVLGTVHALPPGMRWRDARIERAARGADRLVFEIAQPLDPRIAGAALARLGRTPGLPPPSQRLPAAQRGELQAVYRQLGLDDARFADSESWAVALQLGAIAARREGIEPDRGVEPELRALAPGKPVAGLETLEEQFGAFDRLPPPEQDVLLGEIVHEIAENRDADRDTLAAWRAGDVAAIDREAHRGFLADPALREALLVRRTANWVARVSAILRGGGRPLIAVGAAHTAGPQGLPALLAAQGFAVTRVD